MLRLQGDKRDRNILQFQSDDLLQKAKQIKKKLIIWNISTTIPQFLK